jgi:UDPglucose 6-dehydrogenase
MDYKKVGVVGARGWVGRSMMQLFPHAKGYDSGIGQGHIAGEFVKSIEELGDCNFVFICVPTPQKENGQCDTSIVDDIAHKLHRVNQDSILIIRSTVEIGTTERLTKELSHKIVFQPEYLGETQQHPFLDPRTRPFVILGGERKAVQEVANLYKTVYNSDVCYYFSNAKTAELCKYMENSFLATKVIFCNEFADIAAAFGVDYNELRELWLADYRIGRSHTDVYPNKRGFSGKCLPKDTSALVHSSEKAGFIPELLKEVRRINQERYRNP